jgi:hypothetical protein
MVKGGYGKGGLRQRGAMVKGGYAKGEGGYGKGGLRLGKDEKCFY